jgi:hypothetical protein
LAHKGATSDRIVAILEKDHPKAVASESADILHIGLIKLAGEACSGGTGFESTAQLEMFAEYHTFKMVTLRIADAKGHTQKVHKAIGAMTIPEVRKFVVDKTTKPPSKRAKKIKEMARLADDMEPYSESAGSTIDECWAAARG